MPDNSNPQAVRVANEQCRVFAESLLSAIRTARAFSDNYNAGSMDGIFPATNDPIADGSEADGRPRLTNNGVRALKTAADDVLTWAGQGTPTREARLRAITHKGESRF